MPTRLSRLTSPAAVQTAIEEFERLGRDAFLKRYGFGRAKEYFVRSPLTGNLCDSKAILGAACGFQDPSQGPLKPKEFSGGEATVAYRLQELGFEVIRSSESRRPERGDWSAEEVELVVADYLAMLTLELTGQPYNKSQRRRVLLSRLNARTEGSIEFKRCNVSAVMLKLGFPYLRGYQPRDNYQQLLEVVVTKQIRHLSILDEATEAAVHRPVVEPETHEFDHIQAEAPKFERTYAVREESRAYQQGPIRRDYLEREARNRSLGHAGEQFALKFERWRLDCLGASHLARKVEHVSVTQGDGLGFDILSFEPDGRERFVEVKTTAFGQITPFFVSANEARVAREKGDSYRLYRLYEFRSNPRMFELKGAIEQHCRLDPSTYTAHFQ